MCKATTCSVSAATIKRLPLYLSVLTELQNKGQEHISSNSLAEITQLNSSLVKKDLSVVITAEGKPKLGYDIQNLITDIRSYLVHEINLVAVFVGVGKLGMALLSYKGFSEYNLNIVCGFDIDENVINSTKSNGMGKQIFPISKFEHIVDRLNIKIGIITTPKESAQAIANIMIRSGIKAIWNFTSTCLDVPKDIIVKNENLASSLLVITKQLLENQGELHGN